MDFIKYRIEKALEKTKAQNINFPSGEFLKTRAMQEGGVILQTPPPCLNYKWNIVLHFFIDPKWVIENNFVNRSFDFVILFFL